MHFHIHLDETKNRTNRLKKQKKNDRFASSGGKGDRSGQGNNHRGERK